MKLFTFKRTNLSEEEVGVECKFRPGYLYALKDLGYEYRDMNDVILHMTESQKEMLRLQASKDVGDDADQYYGYISMEKVQKCAPIPIPKQDIICLGINYYAHAKEAAAFDQEAFEREKPYPIFFSKRVNRAVADGETVPAYEGLVDSLDYESELAVIIGKDARNVAKEDAFAYVFGYTIVNDVSARNLQTRHKQWYFGKSLDGFTPMGPCIVTADEFNTPPVLKVKSYVNGELRQDSCTSHLIFGIDEVISMLSQGMTLQAGTIISMGTPAGVGMGMNPPQFLKKGDVMTMEIEKIGRLTNPIG